MLPVVYGLTNLVVNIAEEAVEQAGKHISCRAGCGAGCRQIVPISESEAHHVKRLVDDLPEPRRTIVRERFATGWKAVAARECSSACGTMEREPNAVRLGRTYCPRRRAVARFSGRGIVLDPS